MFYGQGVKNKMEALALLSNSNLLVLSDPKGFDFPPSWKLLVFSKGIHELERASGLGDGQGSLVCCSPWGRRVGQD